MFLVEQREEALARGAKVYAEVIDARESFDPSHPPMPTSSRLLAETLKRVSAEGVAVDLEARGVWGGVIKLSLAPSS